jgi:hypothetical protein
MMDMRCCGPDPLQPSDLRGRRQTYTARYSRVWNAITARPFSLCFRRNKHFLSGRTRQHPFFDPTVILHSWKSWRENCGRDGLQPNFTKGLVFIHSFPRVPRNTHGASIHPHSLVYILILFCPLATAQPSTRQLDGYTMLFKGALAVALACGSAFAAPA